MPIVVIEKCQDYDLNVIRESVDRLWTLAGGMDKVLGSAETVLVKPNLLSPRAPEEAVTTHPAVVRAVVESLSKNPCVKRIWVGDSCAGAHSDERLWNKTGMTEALCDTRAELKSFSSQTAPWSCSGSRPHPAPAWLDEVDAIINVPKLKTHALTFITCAVKNMYGMISGSAKAAYHAQYPSPRAMSQFLAEVYGAFRPAFTIVDAIIGLEGEGPANGRPKPIGMLLAGEDAAAIDAVCAETLGKKPESIPLLLRVSQLQLGMIDHNQIQRIGSGVDDWTKVRLKPSIARLLMRVPEPIFQFGARFMRWQPRIDPKLCVRCGVCKDICSQNAIFIAQNDGAYKIDRSKCIVCMCCSESCPQHAIHTNAAFFRRRACRRQKSQAP